jgi:diguanylate cyclase (GGDEF)-like protein/PAS domain S-box-containing protein
VKRAPACGRATHAWNRRSYNVVPYTAILGLFALLPVVLRHGFGVDGWIVLCGLFLCTVLTAVRQLIAFRDSSVLLDRLVRQEERIRSLLEYSSDITSIVDSSGRIGYITPVTGRVLGRDTDSVLGTPVTAYIHPDDLPDLMPGFTRLLATPNASFTYQARYAHSDGSWRWLEVICRNLSHIPSVQGIVSNARDVTQARILSDQLRHQATHDDLTGLANRTLLHDRLAQAADGVATVLLVDLNDFKAVNDTHGHHVGDAVLVGVADRLRAVVPPGATAARLGGDEFAVLLPALDAATAGTVAERFLDLLATPIVVDGHDLRIRASVGIAEGDPADHEALLRHADAAMYEAKRDARVGL